MPFGKHKNKPIGEIDPTYLEWVLANCQQISPDLKRAICTQLGLEVKDDPKDREIAELHASIQELVFCKVRLTPVELQHVHRVAPIW